MNSLIFLNTYEFFPNYLAFLQISFTKKIQRDRRESLQSPRKFLSVTANLVTETKMSGSFISHQNFENFFFKNVTKSFKKFTWIVNANEFI